MNLIKKNIAGILYLSLIFSVISVNLSYATTKSSQNTSNTSIANITKNTDSKPNKIPNTKNINMNEVPYISTYYIKPTVKPNEDVELNFYVTDYCHKEYLQNDNSQIFTITIKIDGKDDIIKTVKAGDNKINLGKFNKEGKQKFSIIAKDQYGRNSHELFNFFLVQNDVKVKEYTMTKEDLIKYNIKKGV